MNKRLEKQAAFMLEADKAKIYFARHICPAMEEMRMMRNTPGIWR